jgi:hypothetical protein
MTRLLTIRLAVMAVGILVWAYGQRADLANVRMVGMIILAIALLLRFLPRRWFGEE